jgi:ferrochelatase
MAADAAKPAGVLVMSYGTPESMDAIESYYTHIRRGRPPSKEQLEDLTRRYEAIAGGIFPLRENTDRQVAALQRKLDKMAGEGQFVCYQGLKHASPFIEDGIKAMASDGIRQGVGIVLAPHYSVMSVGGYIKRAQEEADRQGIRMSFVKQYHLHPSLIAALSERLTEALSRFGQPEQVMVLFSAHSLPEKIRAMGDPYQEQLLETSRAVAASAGIDRWQFTWQSAGQTGEPWLGPDILETLENLAAEGVREVLVAPVGFVSDHLEVLYDIDIEAKQFAAERGIRLERIRMLNDDDRYMTALAESVQNAFRGL